MRSRSPSSAGATCAISAVTSSISWWVRSASASPCAGTPRVVGDVVDQLADVVEPAVGVEHDDRDAGVAHLEHDVPRAEGGVGDDHGRVELEDRLGVELVAVLGDQRQVLGLREVGRDVATDQRVAEAELEDGPRERAVDVEREDPAGVRHGHLGALVVGDGHRQPRLRGVGDGVEGGVGGGDHLALPVAHVGEGVDLGERRCGGPGRHARGVVARLPGRRQPAAGEQQRRQAGDEGGPHRPQTTLHGAERNTDLGLPNLSSGLSRHLVTILSTTCRDTLSTRVRPGSTTDPRSPDDRPRREHPAQG